MQHYTQINLNKELFAVVEIDNITMDRINGIEINLMPNALSLRFEDLELCKQIAKEYIDSNCTLRYMMVGCDYNGMEIIVKSFDWCDIDDDIQMDIVDYNKS